jgi:hypothetical protein
MPAPAASAPRTATRRYQRNLFAWGLLASVLLWGVMAGPFYLGRVYTRDDLGCFHLPTRLFYSQQLARGEPFDWMPQLLDGFYLTGEGQVGGYHPLHWLLYRFCRLEAAMAIELLASYPLMLAGTYFFLRRRRLRPGAALFGGLAFAFSSFSLLHFVHPNAIAVVAHIPWLLAAIDMVFLESSKGTVPFSLTRKLGQSPRRAFPAAGIALLTGSQLLLGYPQYVWFSLLAEGAYTVWIICRNRSAQSGAVSRFAWACPRAAIVAAAKGVGLLLGAVQLLPTAAALHDSVRHAADAHFTNTGALHPLNLLQMVAPYLFTDRVVGGNTHESALYLGVVPLMLLVWLRYRRGGLGSWRGLGLATAGFAALAFVLAMGDTGQIYRLQQLLPLVGQFRCPCRYLVLCQLATSMLAAIAVALLARQLGRGRVSSWQELRPLWVVTGVATVAAAVGIVMQGHWLIAPPARVLIGPPLVATAALLVTLAARGRHWALPAMIVFTALDLGSYGCSYAIYPDTLRLSDYVASVPQPPSLCDVRMAGDLLPPGDAGPHQGNQFTLTGWSRADGYVGLEPQHRLDYRQLSTLQVASVRWVLPTDGTAHIAGLLPHESGWLEVPAPLPRVRLVAEAHASQHAAIDLKQIDVRSTALVEHPLALPKAPPGSVAVVSDRPGRLELQVDCPSLQLLVVAESYHPGWKASVAGQPESVLRTNGDFLGCPVGPGVERVILEFRPESLSIGKALSLLGLGLVCVMFLVNAFKPEARAKDELKPEARAKVLRLFPRWRFGLP